MPGVNDADRRRDADGTEALSQPSAADETGVSSPGRPPAAPALGPPVEPGEVGTLGPYRLVKQLGQGGMGAVYAALDTRLHRRLALKLMLPEYVADADARDRFLREARACAQVIHDNVVTVYDADVRDGVPYIAMQFLEGYPLDEYLKRKGNPTLGQVLRIGRDAAAGLAAAHAKGLVHRDVKPANLWLEAPHGRVKVLDFGLARPVDAEAEITKQGAIVGTPAYMSPEQARGQRVDHRTDLFSLGAVLYRLVTGRLPFQADTTMGVLMALAAEEPLSVREVNPAVPVALADLIHQLLSKVPANRPPSADAVAERLRAIAPSTVSDSPVQPVSAGSVPQVVYVPIQVSAAPANPFADLDVTEADAVPTATPVRGNSRGRTLLASVGAAALVAAVFAAVVVAIRSRDGTVTKADPPDQPPPTRKAKDGKGTATAGPVVTDTRVDRKAAVAVLATGGMVRVSDDEREITSAAELPRTAFTLTEVSLKGKGVTNATLDLLRPCRGIRVLNLEDTSVTDAGLDALKEWGELERFAGGGATLTDAGVLRLAGAPKLKVCFLEGPGITDAALAAFRGNKSLVHLALGGTRVTGSGLVHLKDCAGLTHVNIIQTLTLTGEGFEHLGALPQLKSLILYQTAVADEGLRHVGGAAALVEIGIHSTKVTDRGLEHLSRCLRLAAADVSSNAVTDAGLAHLKACQDLTELKVDNTKVTPAGLADFHANVPACKVIHDGGVLAPVDVERKAAEWVIGAGGKVRVMAGQAQIVTAVADLPAERFTLTGVDLLGTPTPDEVLTNLRFCRNLQALSLSKTRVTGAGLAHVAGSKGLSDLFLTGAPVTADGLAQLQKHPRLTNLVLSETPLTGAGLAHVRGLDRLLFLNLAGTKVADADLPPLKELKALVNLYLGGTPVTDAGVAHLRECRGLTFLDLKGSKVTPKGAAEFHDAVPGCRVEYDGGVLEPYDPERRAAEWVVSVGGKVRVAGAGERDIAAAADLPKDRFEITHVSFVNAPVNDADLDRFGFCTKLSHLSVGGSSVTITDAGLARFKGRKGFRRFDLQSCRGLTDAGLAHLKAIPDLEIVTLDGCGGVTDAGLVHFKDVGGLYMLSLRSTKVTDAGLPTLTDCRKLKVLNLEGTKVTARGATNFQAAVPGCRVTYDGAVLEPIDVDRHAAERVLSLGESVWLRGKGEVRAAKDLPTDPCAVFAISLEGKAATDAGVASLRGLKTLDTLNLVGTRVTDAGLVHLQGLPQLSVLLLDGTQVSDEGLRNLHDCSRLTRLKVIGTRVTAAGAAGLQARLPGCRIEYDGGVLEPKK